MEYVGPASTLVWSTISTSSPVTPFTLKTQLLPNHPLLLLSKSNTPLSLQKQMRQIRQHRRPLHLLQHIPKPDPLSPTNPTWPAPIHPEQDLRAGRLGKKHFRPVAADLAFGAAQAEAFAAFDPVVEGQLFPVATGVQEGVQADVEGGMSGGNFIVLDICELGGWKLRYGKFPKFECVGFFEDFFISAQSCDPGGLGWDGLEEEDLSQETRCFDGGFPVLCYALGEEEIAGCEVE